MENNYVGLLMVSVPQFAAGYMVFSADFYALLTGHQLAAASGSARFDRRANGQWGVPGRRNLGDSVTRSCQSSSPLVQNVACRVHEREWGIVLCRRRGIV